MNYYDARRREDTGRWDFTCSNRRLGTWPVGYCNPTSHDHCGGHDTPEEARECFRRYLLDGAREESYGDWTGCEVCDKPTKKGLTGRPPLGSGHALCDEHRTPEQLAKLTARPGQIMASY